MNTTNLALHLFELVLLNCFPNVFIDVLLLERNYFGPNMHKNALFY